MSNIKYRKDIDGLRAFAVISVILFHLDLSWVKSGFLGVDIFFVISGYLITTILLADLQNNRFSISQFYERRARRILPALFAVIIACIPFAYIWMLPSQLEDFAQSILAVIFFVSNILFWREAGYFAPVAELKPLLHTWSLAVEEQYYLLFPIVLALLWKFNRRVSFIVIIAFTISSFVLAEWASRTAPGANFYLAPTRAWELFAGSICAFLTYGRGQRSSNFLSATGLALIVASIILYDASTPFPSSYTLAPVVGTSLIILYASHTTWTAKLLSVKIVVGIGLISYSAYLWHQPLFVFTRINSFEELSNEYDAVFLALGTYTDMTGGFDNENSPGVYNALDFLIGNTQNVMGITKEQSNQVKPYVSFKGKKVVVLGGGDTAMDCVRTSIRQGATEVTCAYRRDETNMPGSPREVQNAKEEGVNFAFNLQPLDIAIDDKGNTIGVKFVKTQLGAPDTDGRRNPEPIEGSEFVMEADAVVIAFGFLPSPPQWMIDAGVQLDSRGRVLAVDNSDFALQTSKQNIFAGGDMVLGSDLVVTAIDQGRKAALGILDFVLSES